MAWYIVIYNNIAKAEIFCRYIQIFDNCYKNGNMVHVVLTAAIVGCLGYQLLKVIMA